jgi:hypothetical protein
MSYDLLVFAADRAPKEREEFISWWHEQAQWAEDHEYDDPKVSTPELRAWFMEMIQTYPAMNGPFAVDELPEDDAVVTDYSVGKEVIYAAFAWSKAEVAYEAVFALAGKHGVGFFNASSEQGEVWLPNGRGGLELVHSAAS